MAPRPSKPPNPRGAGSRNWEPWIAAALPLLVALVGLVVLSQRDLDARLVDFFYDVSKHDWPWKNDFWTQSVFHKGGRLLVWALAISSVGVTLLAGRTRLVGREFRDPGIYLCAAAALEMGIAALLKSQSLVPCPWHAARYGGELVHGALLAFSPGGVLHGRCFPSGHAASGFAWMSFYYALRDHDLRLAYTGLLGGAVLGALFSATQVMRGAHFPSHDLASLLIVWTVATVLYWACPDGRLWRTRRVAPAAAIPQ